MLNSSFNLKWDCEKTNDLALKIILFGISPFFSFIYSFWRLNTKSSFLVFLLTGMFFGMSFTVSPNDIIDGARHRVYFELDYFITFKDYQEIIYNYLTFDNSVKDLYRHTVSFFVSRFTNNYHWYFFIIAIIYGYFSLKSLRYLTSIRYYKLSISFIILIFIFLIQANIFNINGVRFWTAGWVAIYTIFGLFVSKKLKFLFLLLFTPIIHIAFWIIPLLVLCAVLFDKVLRFKSKDIILYNFYFLSFVFSIFSTSVLSTISNRLPSVFSNLISSYLDEDYMSEINDFERTMTGMYFRIAKLIFVNLMMVFLIYHNKLIVRDSNVKLLFFFTLITFSFVNIFMFIPSLGTRFFGFILPFIAFLWGYCFKGEKYKLFLLFVPIVFFRDIYLHYLYFSSVLDPFDFISSPFYLIYNHLIIQETSF